jgi:hypothetical protein
MGTPQDPRNRHRTKARRTAKEQRLREKKAALAAAGTAAPAAQPAK